MERNEFKVFFAISLFLHAGFFLMSYLQARRSVYITLPVELKFYSPPGAASPAASAPAKEPPKTPPLLQPRSKKEEIAVQKKKESKAAEKKAEAPPSPAPAEPVKNPASAEPGASSMGGGGQISLDTANFPYAYYLNSIRKKVYENWHWTVDFGKLRTVIYFRINTDGSITNVAVKTPSGDGIFDQQALRAVKLADPFPPLPSGYQQDSMGVNFEFRGE